MRLLIEIFLIGALIYLGWEKPFREYVPASLTNAATSPSPTPAITTTRTAPAAPYQPYARSTSTPATVLAPVATPQPAATRSGSWMWDANHHSPLDAPHKSATPH